MGLIQYIYRLGKNITAWENAMIITCILVFATGCAFEPSKNATHKDELSTDASTTVDIVHPPQLSPSSEITVNKTFNVPEQINLYKTGDTYQLQPCFTEKETVQFIYSSEDTEMVSVTESGLITYQKLTPQAGGVVTVYVIKIQDQCETKVAEVVVVAGS